ncbi:MAG TPA: biotin/lipoyl-binding protein, partial [Magnetococcales bacterium]|nr:biotin/lipoyl-binding protein [Magnetococcales bacterium]
LRQDLRLLPGGAGSGGEPSWLLWDQPRNLFFRLGWAEFEMLSRWTSTPDPQALIDQVNHETTLNITPQRLVSLVSFLVTQGLTQLGSADFRKYSQHQSVFQFLLHHYLFFRIPLARPDPFLTAIVPVTTFLTHGLTLLISGLALLLGGYLTLRQWDAFTGSVREWTTPEGMKILFVTILSAKLVHELGHALAAKRLGCRVPAMGIAFLVMWPFFYTDTNETWRLTQKKDRFSVAMAGIAAESLLAVWALLAWAMVDDGPWRGALFSLVAVIWTSTLLLNVNPFMRFDGYFMISDALDIPNLHERAFAMGKWFIRTRILGASLSPPELWTPKLRAFLIVFALGTWLYRLVLYFGIALLVYHLFFKMLGAFLMAVELYWFLFRPIVGEWGWWWQNRKEMAVGHVRLWMLLVLLGGGLFFLPWQSPVKMPAVLRSSVYARVYPPEGGMIQSLAVRVGQQVKQGEPLLKLDSPELNGHLIQARLEVVRLQGELTLLGSRFSTNRLVAEQQLASANARVLGLTVQKNRLDVASPITGTITMLRDGLVSGLTVGRADNLLEIRQFGSEHIVAYVAEKNRHLIVPGSQGVFYPDHASFPVMNCLWVNADPFAVAQLEDHLLASVHGGPIEAERLEHDALRPIQPFFIIRFKREGFDPAVAAVQSVPGMVILPGQPDTLAGRVWKNAAALWVREMGW